ncbi:MAG TPA: hypothetical protein VE715_04965 [Blastocatellia bacterium]|nr:hypothetical protein [Blastocatellia bacterium]
MTVGIKPLAEITHEALSVLFKYLGVANTMRFISQFTTGYGNYTEERREIYADMSVDDIVIEIEKDREQS